MACDVREGASHCVEIQWNNLFDHGPNTRLNHPTIDGRVGRPCGTDEAVTWSNDATCEHPPSDSPEHACKGGATESTLAYEALRAHRRDETATALEDLKRLLVRLITADEVKHILGGLYSFREQLVAKAAERVVDDACRTELTHPLGVALTADTPHFVPGTSQHLYEHGAYAPGSAYDHAGPSR